MESLKKKKKEKRPLSFTIPNENSSVTDFVLKIKSILNEFQIIHRDISITSFKADLTIKSYQNTWTGQRRKRREMKRKQEEKPHLKLESEKLQSGESQIKLAAQGASSFGSRKRKADEIDEGVLQKGIKEDCLSGNPIPSDSSSCCAQNSNADMVGKPILNCHIHLMKIENDFLFQLVSDSLSNLEIMHQVFQLFHNKLIPQTNPKNVK